MLWSFGPPPPPRGLSSCSPRSPLPGAGLEVRIAHRLRDFLFLPYKALAGFALQLFTWLCRLYVDKPCKVDGVAFGIVLSRDSKGWRRCGPGWAGKPGTKVGFPLTPSVNPHRSGLGRACHAKLQKGSLKNEPRPPPPAYEP